MSSLVARRSSLVSVLIVLAGSAGAQGTVTLFVDDNPNGSPLPPSPSDGLGWATAFLTVQEALVDARARALTPSTADDVREIWVAAGTYLTTPTTDRTISHELVPGVEMFGGFAGNESGFGQRARLFDQTILSGDIDGDPRNQLADSLHVVRIDDLGEYRLDGFSVMYGAAVPSGPATLPTDADDWGGGLLVNGAGVGEEAIDVVVTNCRFQACLAAVGAGVMAQGVDSFRMSRTRILNCIAYYPVFDLDVSGTVVPSGAGGGAFLWRCDEALVYHSEFVSNRATYGGGIGFMGGNADRMVNCLVAKNSATGGGGVLVYDGIPGIDPLRVSHLTIADNVVLAANPAQPQILLDGGGVHVHGGSGMEVFSTIVWGNRNTLDAPPNGEESFAGSGLSSLLIDSSDIQFSQSTPTWLQVNPPGSPNPGSSPYNISEDPLFVSAGAGDYRLTSSFFGPFSPCIERANDFYLDGTNVEAGTGLLVGDVLDVDEDGDFADDVSLDLRLTPLFPREIDDIPGNGSPLTNDYAVVLIKSDMGCYEAASTSP